MDRDVTLPVAWAPANLHKIVIVGGGAAGIELATRLGTTLGKSGKADVVLVERARTHIWKPLLHSVAAGSLNPGAHELSYMAQAHWKNFRFRFGAMVGLDRENKLVLLAATKDEEGREITPERAVPYDTLILAVGSVTNDFGTPGAAQNAVPLETLDQAIRFNHRVVNACIRAYAQETAVLPGQLHMAVIGAGATGTELAAELNHTVRKVIGYGLRSVDYSKDVKIILIEGAPRILPALPERIGTATFNILTKMGIEVRINARVSEVRPDGVMLADGSFIPSELVVWAAGVKAPELLSRLPGLEVNRINQLVVQPTLQTTNDPDIFAIGDCAACPKVGGEGNVPPRAQAAHQQANHMIKQINNLLAGKRLEPYVYRDFGSLVSLGSHSTVGNLMGSLVGKNLFIEGYFALMMYRALHKMHEIALHGWVRTAMNTVAHGFSHKGEPDVKLH